MRRTFLILILVTTGTLVNGQRAGELSINGQILPYMIDDCGDTLVLASREEPGDRLYRIDPR